MEHFSLNPMANAMAGLPKTTACSPSSMILPGTETEVILDQLPSMIKLFLANVIGSKVQ
jgi:hypothetical protein